MDKTALTIFAREHDLSFLKPQFEAADPSLDVVVWPDPRSREAEVALGWGVPDGLYDAMPRLRLVHSIAAGVDNIIQGQNLRDLPVCRVVDPLLAQGMLQYVLWGVLLFHRRLDEALAQQPHQVWKRPDQQAAHECRVGVMGLGEMGGPIVELLPRLGYSVSGWSRTPRSIPGVTTWSGEEGLAPFLAETDVLVCLLPLTAQTRGILNRYNLSRLPRGAALIHCGRGEHLVEDELLDCLSSGQLRGALIDVFAREPLPAGHPLWSHPGVIVTPHMATMARRPEAVRQIVANIARLRQGQALANRVDLQRGY